MNSNKRQYRELNSDTKLKISQRLKNRGKSADHAQKISDSMKKYWATVPKKPIIEKIDFEEDK